MTERVKISSLTRGRILNCLYQMRLLLKLEPKKTLENRQARLSLRKKDCGLWWAWSPRQSGLAQTRPMISWMGKKFIWPSQSWIFGRHELISCPRQWGFISLTSTRPKSGSNTKNTESIEQTAVSNNCWCLISLEFPNRRSIACTGKHLLRRSGRLLRRIRELTSWSCGSIRFWMKEEEIGIYVRYVTCSSWLRKCPSRNTGLSWPSWCPANAPSRFKSHMLDDYLTRPDLSTVPMWQPL